jgi:hypothetical protein
MRVELYLMYEMLATKLSAMITPTKKIINTNTTSPPPKKKKKKQKQKQTNKQTNKQINEKHIPKHENGEKKKTCFSYLKSPGRYGVAMVSLMDMASI